MKIKLYELGLFFSLAMAFGANNRYSMSMMKRNYGTFKKILCGIGFIGFRVFTWWKTPSRKRSHGEPNIYRTDCSSVNVNVRFVCALQQSGAFNIWRISLNDKYHFEIDGDTWSTQETK